MARMTWWQRRRVERLTQRITGLRKARIKIISIETLEIHLRKWDPQTDSIAAGEAG
jgi:hypothetical protein